MTTDPRIIEAEAVVTKADPNAFKHSEVRKIKRGFKAAIDLVAEQQHTIIDKQGVIESLDSVMKGMDEGHREAIRLLHENRIDLEKQIAELTTTNDSLRDDVTALIIERNQIAKRVRQLTEELTGLSEDTLVLIREKEQLVTTLADMKNNAAALAVAQELPA